MYFVPYRDKSYNYLCVRSFWKLWVSINYLTNAKEIQIKMAQGAKQAKVGNYRVQSTSWIAEIKTQPICWINSPPPHHDIYIEDLSQLIFDLKCQS
jgi:glutamate synthase (ferredoxin)